MELKECITCGSHSFTENKCDYCGNKYNDDNESKLIYGNTWCDDGTEDYTQNFNEYLNRTEVTEIGFQEQEKLKEDNIKEILDSFRDEKWNEIAFKIMIIILISIIWFAVTVFIPPLFIITIILLVVYGAYRLTNRNK